MYIIFCRMLSWHPHFYPVSLIYLVFLIIICFSPLSPNAQGLQRNELNDSLELAWTWMQKLKEKICSIAFHASGMVSALQFF